jgi:hypothetical protein
LTLAFAVACLSAACANDDVSASATSSPHGIVVARVQISDPHQALSRYLQNWIRRFNNVEIVEVVPVDGAIRDSYVPLVLADGFRLEPLTPATAEHASYRADFQFSRSEDPTSSAVQPALVRSSSSYDLSWDEETGIWTITLTSAAPNQGL